MPVKQVVCITTPCFNTVSTPRKGTKLTKGHVTVTATTFVLYPNWLIVLIGCYLHRSTLGCTDFGIVVTKRLESTGGDTYLGASHTKKVDRKVDPHQQL